MPHVLYRLPLDLSKKKKNAEIAHVRMITARSRCGACSTGCAGKNVPCMTAQEQTVVLWRRSSPGSQLLLMWAGGDGCDGQAFPFVSSCHLCQRFPCSRLGSSSHPSRTIAGGICCFNRAQHPIRLMDISWLIFNSLDAREPTFSWLGGELMGLD